MKKKLIALFVQIWKIIEVTFIITRYMKHFNMKSQIIKVLIFGIFICLYSGPYAQGISRSSGIGIRASIWKPHNIGKDVNVGFAPITTTVGSGEGGYIYYFTRLEGK